MLVYNDLHLNVFNLKLFNFESFQTKNLSNVWDLSYNNSEEPFSIINDPFVES